MTWNFLQVVELGATSYGLYPVPTGRRGDPIGLELTERDTNRMEIPIAGLKVIRADRDGAWVPSLNVLRTKGRMAVTDDRVAVTFDRFVPKDQSSFDPIALVRPDGSRAKRPKQMLVGHVALAQIRQIGVRQASAPTNGRDAINDGLGSIIIAAVDATDTNVVNDQAGVVVAVEIIIGDRADPVAVVNDVLSRVVSERLRSSALNIGPATRSAWLEMARIGFTPPAGEVQTYDFERSQPVRRRASNAASPHLIPPSDTSPVPTMQPTPSEPMTALARPALADPPELDDQPTMAAPPIGPSAVPATAPPVPTPDDPPARGRLPRPLPAPTHIPSAPAEVRPGVLLPAPPPPGSTAEWRRDPFGRFDLRYWDGFGWTEHVHDGAQQTTDPPR